MHCMFLAFWFGLWQVFGMCFDCVDIFFMGGFAFLVDWELELSCLLFGYAGFFDFVGAKAFACFLLAILLSYGWFYVVHVGLLPLQFFPAVFSCASAVAWSHFFCSSALVV